jgi:hypothetical protein
MVVVDYFDVKDRKITIPPMMLVRLSDPFGTILFQHELPLNLKVNTNIHPNMVAYKTLLGQYVGLYL